MYFVILGFLFILPKHKHTSCVKLFLFLLKKFLLLLLMFGKQNKAKSQDGKLGSALISLLMFAMAVHQKTLFIIWSLKVLMFDTSLDILALLFCLSWLYHKMHHTA